MTFKTLSRYQKQEFCSHCFDFPRKNPSKKMKLKTLSSANAILRNYHSSMVPQMNKMGGIFDSVQIVPGENIKTHSVKQPMPANVVLASSKTPQRLAKTPIALPDFLKNDIRAIKLSNILPADKVIKTILDDKRSDLSLNTVKQFLQFVINGLDSIKPRQIESELNLNCRNLESIVLSVY